VLHHLLELVAGLLLFLLGAVRQLVGGGLEILRIDLLFRLGPRLLPRHLVRHVAGLLGGVFEVLLVLALGVFGHFIQLVLGLLPGLRVLHHLLEILLRVGLGLLVGPVQVLGHLLQVLLVELLVGAVARLIAGLLVLLHRVLDLLGGLGVLLGEPVV